MKAVQFKNFTNEDFTWKWDGIAYTFAAGQTIFLEDFKAEHFAKHLVDRELNRLNIATNNEAERSKLISECFPVAEAVTPLEALQLNNKKAPAKKKAKVEAEFEDLEEEA